MLINLVLGEETINIISAYAPEIELKNPIKHKIWEEKGWTYSRVTIPGKDFYWGRGHVGKDSGIFERIHFMEAKDME